MQQVLQQKFMNAFGSVLATVSLFSGVVAVMATGV
jgi:hypothetical protein